MIGNYNTCHTLTVEKKYTTICGTKTCGALTTKDGDICNINGLNNDELFDYVTERHRELGYQDIYYIDDRFDASTSTHVCIGRETNGGTRMTLNLRIDGTHYWVYIWDHFFEIFADERITICFEIESSCEFLGLSFPFHDTNIRSKIVVRIKKVKESGTLYFGNHWQNSKTKFNVQFELMEIPKFIEFQMDLTELSILDIEELVKLKMIHAYQTTLRDFIEKIVDRLPGTLPKSLPEEEVGLITSKLKNIEEIQVYYYGDDNGVHKDSYSLCDLRELITSLSELNKK